MRPFDLVGVFHTWWIRQSIALIKFSCIYIFIIVDQSDSFNVSGLNNKEVQSPQLKKTFMIVDELYIDRHCFFFLFLKIWNLSFVHKVILSFREIHCIHFSLYYVQPALNIFIKSFFLSLSPCIPKTIFGNGLT